MKPRKYQFLQVLETNHTRGRVSKLKVWPCRYVACKRVLNDLDYNINAKYCLFHRAIRVREKNAASYQKRIGCVRPSKMEQIIYLLKTNGRASTYELLAFTGIRKKEVLRALMWNIRKKGHSVTHNKSTNNYYMYNGTTKKYEK